MNGLPCQDAELKAEKYGGKGPLKMLEKFGCEKYAMPKIMRVNTVPKLRVVWHTSFCAVCTNYIK
jgi:hypothetical protein